MHSCQFAQFAYKFVVVKCNWDKLQKLALKEIEATLTELPQPLSEQARRLPVTFERVSNDGLQAAGIELDTLGVFTGAEFADGATVLPPQIILFLENLWYSSGRDEIRFRAEVRTTFLHELGHYLGLDEEDLNERGLK